MDWTCSSHGRGRRFGESRRFESEQEMSEFGKEECKIFFFFLN